MFGKKKRAREAAVAAEQAAALQQMDERIENTKSITNLFNRMSALNDLYKEASFAWISGDETTHGEQMVARSSRILELQNKIVRDNYDAIKDSGQVKGFFSNLSNLMPRMTFDKITTERAFEGKPATVLRTTKGLTQ